MKTAQNALIGGAAFAIAFSVANGISTWYLDEPLSDWVETKVGGV